MRAIAFVVLLSGLSTAAQAAPEFPVELTSEYCGFGPCLPILATLFEDGTCEVDLVGPCTWRYSRRLRVLEVTFIDDSVWEGVREGRCFTGVFDSPLMPAPEELVMCAE